MLRALAGWHEKHPDLPGPGKPALLAGLRAWPEAIAEAVLLDRLAHGDIVQRDAVFHLPGHQARLAPSDAAAWRRIEPALAADPLRPPRGREVADLVGLAPEDAESLLMRL